MSYVLTCAHMIDVEQINSCIQLKSRADRVVYSYLLQMELYTAIYFFSCIQLLLLHKKWSSSSAGSSHLKNKKNSCIANK